MLSSKLEWSGLALILAFPVLKLGGIFVVVGAIVLIVGAILQWMNK